MRGIFHESHDETRGEGLGGRRGRRHEAVNSEGREPSQAYSLHPALTIGPGPARGPEHTRNVRTHSVANRVRRKRSTVCALQVRHTSLWWHSPAKRVVFVRRAWRVAWRTWRRIWSTRCCPRCPYVNGLAPPRSLHVLPLALGRSVLAYGARQGPASLPESM